VLARARRVSSANADPDHAVTVSHRSSSARNRLFSAFISFSLESNI
jgi:hypothetical protein